MNNNFQVSVVITSYNQRAYLIEAIESVISQTVRPHEIIIADDHSTDGESVACIRNYMARYPGWIKGVFQPENVGIPKNRNAGLRQVTGNYVAILDGDDRFLPKKLELELAALTRQPATHCVYSNIRFIDSASRPIGLRDTEIQPSGEIFTYVARGKFGLLRSMLINYEMLQQVGLMDERFPKYDGFDLTVQLAKRGHIAYVPEPLTEYRVYPTSDSKSLKPEDHLRDLHGIFEKMLPLLANLPLREQAEIINLWQQQLFNLLKEYSLTYLPDTEKEDFSSAWTRLMESQQQIYRQQVTENHKIHEQLNTMANSRSWRLTTLPRKLARMWRRWMKVRH
jgi:glycosyltransferase involved in cell wall biosynthesis